MDEQLKQIGERLKGLRDVLDIPVSEMAETIGISSEKYEDIEKEIIDSQKKFVENIIPNLKIF